MGQFSISCTNIKKSETMPETRVPMTLRDHFLQDPFFTYSWSEMDKVREHFSKQAQIMSKQFEDNWSNSERSVTKNVNNESQSSIVPSGDSSIFRSLMMPRKWMMPKLIDGDIPEHLWLQAQ